jgi:hypothetical protein
MSGKSTFTVAVDGDTISIPLSRARMLCPAEVEAMEEAGKQVSEAAGRGDSSAMAAAGEELQRRMQALVHALAARAGKEQTDTL